MNKRKAVAIGILIVFLIAVTGLLVYQGFIEKSMETRDYVRCVLIYAGVIGAFLKMDKGPSVRDKKGFYTATYGEYIGDAFSDNKKAYSKLIDVLECYNNDKPSQAIKKLNKLYPQGKTQSEKFVMNMIFGLCFSEIGMLQEAVNHYETASEYKEISTVYSNLGLCYSDMGKTQKAIDAYHKAVVLDRTSEFPYNNLASLYFKENDYENALGFAKLAISINSKMVPALNTAAMSCYFLGDTAGYDDYFRKAVSAGGNGEDLKQAIKYYSSKIETEEAEELFEEEEE